MSAIVILSSSAREDVQKHSAREPQTLFHVAGTGLFARGRKVAKVSPSMAKMLLLLAAARGHILQHADIVEGVYGDDADGGPLHPKRSLSVMRCRFSRSLGALRLRVVSLKHFGLELCFEAVPALSGPIVLPDLGRASQHWLPRARAMRERGASYGAIADAIGRDISVVYRAINGCPKKQAGRHPYRYGSQEAQKRHWIRKQARKQARETSEPVEQIYARWGCETVDRSKLWDQRRAAQPSLEARS